MIANTINLKDKRQTAAGMYKLVDTTSADLSGLDKMPLLDFYDFVKNIPYRQDKKPREIIARPKHLLKYRRSGLDCKKKAILIASWAKRNNVPFRFVATSRRPTKKIHHVYPELKIADRYIPVDATYNTNRINEKKQLTAYQILKRGNV